MVSTKETLRRQTQAISEQTQTIDKLRKAIDSHTEAIDNLTKATGAQLRINDATSIQLELIHQRLDHIVSLIPAPLLSTD